MSVVVVSCTRDSLFLEAGKRTKVFTLEQVEDLETGTKVAETAGNNFAWSSGDKLKYYNLDAGGAVTSVSVQSSEVNSDGPATTFDIEYTYPTDKELVTVFLGSGLENKTMSGLQKDRFTVEDGIPAIQDGKLIPNMVSAARGSIEASAGLTMRHMQTYISFSLNADRTVAGKFNKIVISDRNEDVNVAGNATYVFDETTGELSSCSISSGGVQAITISGEVTVGKVYYVAICPQNFTGGLRVTLYNGTTKLAYATTRIGNSLTPGKINNLGALDFNWIIPANEIPVITPTQSSICNKGGWNMTKQLWCSFSPSDVTGVTWAIIKAKKGTDAATTDASDIEGYGTITPKGEVDYDGKKQFTAILTPAATFTDGWFKVRATLAGDEKYSAYAYVVVGDFIDMGGSVLWARSNLIGSDTGSDLAANTSDRGDYYMWGWLTAKTSSEFTEKKPSDAAAVYKTRWSGDYTVDDANGFTSNLTSLGGKYNTTDGLTTLEKSDDVAYKGHNTWHIPTKAEIDEMAPFTGTGNNAKRTNKSIENINGVTYFCYTSNVIGFTDVKLGFSVNGMRSSMEGGGIYHAFSDMFVASSTLYTSGDIPDIYNIGYYRPYEMPYFLCDSTLGQFLYRYDYWAIRPVCAKSYPDVIDASNP